MFRKRNGSLGFSVSNFVNAAVPSLGMGTVPNAWCAALGQDMLYAHQMSSRQPGAPFALDEHSLFVGGICEHEGTSLKVFHKLGRAGILDEQGCVLTHKIEGKKFPHQVPILSQPRQRDLVNLLFWWEEECQRLRKLIDEEKELSKQIKRIERKDQGDVAEEESETDENLTDGLRDDHERRQLLDNMRFEREKLRMRIRQRPSERRADVEAGTDDLLVRAQTAPQVRRHTEPLLHAHERSQEFKPPAYRP